MPFAVGAKITGLDPLLAALKAKGEKLAKGAAKKAVREGARPIRQAAKALAPVRHDSAIPGYQGGLLRKSIIIKVGIGRRSGQVYAVIGPGTAFKMVRPRGAGRGAPRQKLLFKAGRFATKGGKSVLIAPQYYAHLVELGTRPHALGKGGSLGKGVQSGRLHPGARAYPFLGPAFRSRLGEARANIARVLKSELLGAG